MINTTAATLVELLRARAQSQPDRLAYAFLNDGEGAEVRVTYGELDGRARAIAARLGEAVAPGERALLLYPPGLEFIAAFFGALYAGVVAVPAYPPHSARLERTLPRLQGIARNAAPAVALTTAALAPVTERFRTSGEEFRGIRVLVTDEVTGAEAAGWRAPAVDAETLAFLQYTSGSTGAPRGVMVTHGNLLHNQGLIHAAFGHPETVVGVGWLPLYHDMGLIGNVLQTLYIGGSCMLMSPVAFLQRPARWLEAISRFRATISGGPNFAYDLCARKVPPAQRAELDLSSWTLAYTGAEPVRTETLERFATVFGPCGFRREALHPCYGLAEATLFVTGGGWAAAPAVRHVSARALGAHEVVAMAAGEAGSTAVVSCGRSAGDQTVVIVDPETARACASDRIGEIWVAGPSVARGYWRRPEETAATFEARRVEGGGQPYLRTGDLGFEAEGEIYVTGRLKDLLIIRGRNHYPQDIEATVEQSHAGLRVGAGAACSVEVNGEERVVIVQEVERQYCRGPAAELDGIVQAIRAGVAAEHEVEVYAIRLLGPGAIPKTSSGKIQRHACRAQFLAGSLDPVAEWTAPLEGSAERRGVIREAEGARAGARAPVVPTAEEIHAWLTARLSERMQVSPEAVDPRRPFADYGLDSLAAVSLSGELEEWLGRRLSPTLAWEYPSIQALARHLAGETPEWAREVPSASAEPIAIIGIGCRFPGAPDAASFWRLLRSGGDAVREVPVDRWDAASYYDADPEAPGKMNTRWGGFLEGIDRFDPAFFGIAPREAVRMDPQQRLLLEVAWAALQDGGQVPGQLAGTRTGVFVGISTNDYARRQEEDPLGDAYAGTGNALSIAANRLSYLLNLRGPSLAVDTACSSSLVAVHLACASLASGESTLALCGGVNVMLSPLVTVNFTKSGFMSPDGRCKAFDARANGYVRGEGAGLVVLKPLARARADGDPIYAVIRGSAVNQDGRSNGLTAPNPAAQEAVLAEAWERAGVEPGQAQYVEAHGTGTLLGDPIEARALARVMGQGREPGRVCALGSVKTNIGHLEAAAGIAGLIKVALALRQGEIPASLHYETPNPHIAFQATCLRVQREAGPWPDAGGRRLAGVSSFGFGGTNAHVVLEAGPMADMAPSPGEAPEGAGRCYFLPISAHSPEALRALAEGYRSFLGAEATGATLHDICYTAGARRDHLDHRLGLVGRTARELVDQLERFLRGEARGSGATGRVQGMRAPRVALVFSGQGAEWPGMAAELLEDEPAFRGMIERDDALLRGDTDWSLLEELRGDSPRPHGTARTQPVLVALEVALAALWGRWGIAPGAVVGHSLGEIAAACVAGVLSAEEALALAARRGRLMQREAGRGKMAVLELGAEEAGRAVARHGGRLAVAAWNAPGATVVSGEPAAIEELLAELARGGIGARVLPGSVAFHGPQMAAAAAELTRALGGLKPSPARLGLVSTVTGGQVEGRELTGEYWGRNAREPVRFAQAIEALLEEGYDAFVEVGPHAVLAPAIVACARERGREIAVVPSLRRHEDGARTMLEGLAALYCRGAVPAWAALYPSRGRAVALPSYPWQRERFWIDAALVQPAFEGRAGGEGPREVPPRLDELVYEHRWQPRALPDPMPEPLLAPAAIARATKAAAARDCATELGLVASYATLEPELDALCSAYVLKAFRDLGVALEPGERFSAAALAARLGVAARHRRLLDRYLEFLGEDGHLRRIGAEWEAGARAVAAPEITWRDLLRRHPAFHGELVLLERCARQLGGILRGEIEPLQVIFPDGSLAAAEHLYQDSPSMRLSNALVRRAIAAIAAAAPPGRRLRVLEVGAGTGGVTGHALRALPDEARYVFTDVSPQFLGKAAEKFRAHPGVEYRRLDIEADPVAQGFEANAFDLVLASEVLHATTDLRRTLDHVGKLLASEGLLVLLETVRPARWVDLVFGLTEGWWRFADRDLRPSYPLLSLPSWRALLAEAGFADIREASGRHDDAVDNAVILARGPRLGSVSAPGPEELAAGRGLGGWIVFADRGGFGERAARALGARGARCALVFASDGYRRRARDQFEVSPGRGAELERVVREALGEGAEACRGIVHLWNLDAPSPDQASAEDIEAAQTAGSTSVVRLAQALASIDATHMPRLWLVTRGAAALDGAARPLSFAQAPVWGLARVIASEMPGLRATLVDIGGEAGDAEVRALVDEVTADDAEGEVALRGSARHVHRYVRRPEGRPRIVPMGTEPFRLEITTPGRLDSLTLVEAPRRAPGPGEVEIEVVASALNFSDVVKSLGLAPPASDPTPILGLECSGRVSRVGPGVEGLQTGSEVVAIAPHSFAPFVTTGAGFVAPKPPQLSFEEAATIPIAFLTASYALCHLGRLSSGERVLIHSATGGVGLAAIRIAERAGAEIFATAGTPEKRDLLRALGIRHVMDSRSTAFADEVFEKTGGAGVDLVLNSLTGEAIARGLAALSDHGRFLEIGTHDISRNSRLGLAPFRKNLAFFGIDLDRALRERPRVMSSLFRDLIREFAAGTLRPLPHRVFPISNAAGAFRHMATGQHIGKIVVSLEEREVPVAAAPARVPVRGDGTYLITGGLGGFGLALARWMVERGARHLVLMGRGGDAAAEARRAVMELRRGGVEVVVAAADVTRRADVARVLRDIESAMPPLRGVAHAATVLEDGLLVSLDEARLERVRAPKMSGAFNLHTETLGAALDFFVLSSSMFSVLGIPGQASAAAANAFVDALAHYRRARGLPALAVNWGHLAEAGGTARQPAVAARLEAQGVRSVGSGEALAALDRLLGDNAAQAGVMRIDWSRWAAARGPAPISPRLARLVRDAETGEGGRESAGLDRQALLAAAPAERRARLQEYLRAQIGRVLGLPSSQVDVEQPLGRLGLDSLMAVELRNRLEADLGIGLTAVKLLEGPSVAGLTREILARLDAGALTPPAPLAPTAAEARARGGEMPLSSAQRWLWVLHQLGPDQPWCNLPLALRLRGALDVPVLERCLGEVARRHEVLRTCFPMVEDRPVARIVGDPAFALAVSDLAGLPEPVREARARQLAAEEARAPFDLARGALWRAGLLRLGERDHVLLVTMHHVVADGWSLDVVRRELEALYPEFCAGRPSPLAELPMQYADFARREAEWLASEALPRQLEYWTRRLAGAPPALSFPTDHPRTAGPAYRGAVAHLVLPSELARPLRELGRAEGCTLYMTLLAAFQTLLFRYTGQDDLTVGSFTSSRTRPELDSLVGCFVNHLVLRADLSGNPSFRALLRRVREVTLEAYAHQDVPFELLLDALSIGRDSSRTPLFQVAFAFDPAPRLTLPGLTIADLGIDHVHSNFDFTLRVREDTDGGTAPFNATLNMVMEYNARLFEAVTIDRLLGAFRTLVAGIGADPDRGIAALPLLSAADQHELLVEWNGSAREATAAQPTRHGERPGGGLESVALEKLRRVRQRRIQGSGGAAIP